MNNDFIEIMHDRLSQHEMIEPSGLWQDINNSLDSRSSKKKGFIASRSAIYRAVAGVAAAALVGVVMWVTLRDDGNHSNELASNSSTPSVETKPVLPHNGEESIEPLTHESLSGSDTPQSHHASSSKKEHQLAATNKKEHISPSKIESSSTQEQLASSNTPPQSHSISSSQTEKEFSTSISEKQQSTQTQDVAKSDLVILDDTLSNQVDTLLIIPQEPVPQLQQLWAITEKPRENQLPLEMSLHYNGFLASAGLTNSGDFDYFKLANENTFPDPLEPQVEGPVEVAEKEELGMPIRVGLAVWYPLGEKWRVGSGIVYTHLTRKTTKFYRSGNILKNEKANYLGIPIEVSRILWNRKHWVLYANAGAMIELNLKSSLREETNLELLQVKDNRDKRPQFSVLAGLGLQYNVGDRVGLYLEPGASYYFKNGADDNIYISHPLRFDINLGLRIILGKKR